MKPRVGKKGFGNSQVVDQGLAARSWGGHDHMLSRADGFNAAGLVAVDLGNAHVLEKPGQWIRKRALQSAVAGALGGENFVVNHLEVLPFLVQEGIKKSLNHGMASPCRPNRQARWYSQVFQKFRVKGCRGTINPLGRDPARPSAPSKKLCRAREHPPQPPSRLTVAHTCARGYGPRLDCGNKTR